MNWTAFANLIPVLVRLEPVIVKYGPAAIALYKADEAQAIQLFGDVAAAVETPSSAAFLGLLMKWGPTLTKFVQTEGPVVQQFIADVKAAIGDTSAAPSLTPSVTPPVLSGPAFQFPTQQVPQPAQPGVTFP